jgi:DNA-binding MarR family transcriptional regulator
LIQSRFQITAYDIRVRGKFSVMEKQELLEYLANAQESDATEVASVFDVTYAAAAMALLRLSRQGLVKRFIDTESGMYWYCLSPRGRARLDFFHS